MFAAMNSLTNALVTEVTEDTAWLGFLDAQDKVKPGAIGCIGYCMSGRYVTTVAPRFPGVALRSRHCHRRRGLTASPDRSDQR